MFIIFLGIAAKTVETIILVGLSFLPHCRRRQKQHGFAFVFVPHQGVGVLVPYRYKVSLFCLRIASKAVDVMGE
jgi:hypothetical protein